MALVNLTSGPDFLLLGLMDDTVAHPVLFLLFLSIYLLNAMGNLSMVVLVRSDGALCSPMYYFLGHLSFVDACFTTVTVPRLLVSLLHPAQAISFQACFAQMYFFLALGVTESYLLAAMSYDRAVAVCQPLHYTAVMTPWRCAALVGASWAVAHLHSLLHTLLISTLKFCGPNVINHFYCDLPQLFQLSCSSTQLNEQLLFAAAAFMGVAPLVLIMVSYAHVVAAVLRIRSSEGRKKAFSTCGSHLTVVGIFYGTGVFSYMRLGSVESSDKDKGIGILNTVVSPMLNPLIYSLRNPDVKGALRRVLTGKLPPK
uniref:olfactory receptor 3A3-like n=1 Tax=Ictidomys tridecemlineatus TaxID=43179 RepID=UPI001A9DA824|nr:olfactory receptor 3A3-like [Ictidomys tridecemlineatus]